MEAVKWSANHQTSRDLKIFSQACDCPKVTLLLECPGQELSGVIQAPVGPHHSELLKCVAVQLWFRRPNNCGIGKLYSQELVCV